MAATSRESARDRVTADVSRDLRDGLSVREIAAKRELSTATVYRHKARALAAGMSVEPAYVSVADRQSAIQSANPLSPRFDDKADRDFRRAERAYRAGTGPEPIWKQTGEPLGRMLKPFLMGEPAPNELVTLDDGRELVRQDSWTIDITEERPVAPHSKQSQALADAIGRPRPERHAWDEQTIRDNAPEGADEAHVYPDRVVYVEKPEPDALRAFADRRSAA